MKKNNLILILIIFLVSMFSVNALVVPDYNGTSTLIDRDYILGNSLILYNHIPYLMTGSNDLISKIFTGTSIVDTWLNRNTEAQILGVPVTLSDNEYKVYESIEPFLGEKLGIILNTTDNKLMNGEDSRTAIYYDMKSQLLMNINIMWDYLISLFIILKETMTIIIQLFVFVTAVFIFIELLPMFFIFIKKKMLSFAKGGKI